MSELQGKPAIDMAELSSFVEKYYDLGAPLSIERLLGGGKSQSDSRLLTMVQAIERGCGGSDSFKLETETGSYFIKVTRASKPLWRSHLEEGLNQFVRVHSLESGSCPVLPLTSTRTGALGATWDQRRLSVAPFVSEGTGFSWLAPNSAHEQIISTGAILARTQRVLQACTLTELAEMSKLDEETLRATLISPASMTPNMVRLEPHKLNTADSKSGAAMTAKLLRQALLAADEAAVVWADGLSGDVLKLVHSDFHPGNLIYSADFSEAKFVIDFEYAHFDREQFDLAYAASIFGVFSRFAEMFHSEDWSQGITDALESVMNRDVISALLKGYLSWSQENETELTYVAKKRAIRQYLPSGMQLSALMIADFLLDRLHQNTTWTPHTRRIARLAVDRQLMACVTLRTSASEFTQWLDAELAAS